VLQTLAFVVDSLFWFVVAWSRVLLPATAGFWFGWEAIGFLLARGQTPYIEGSMRELGISPWQFQFVGGAVVAVVATVMFSQYVHQLRREWSPRGQRRGNDDAR